MNPVVLYAFKIQKLRVIFQEICIVILPKRMIRRKVSSENLKNFDCMIQYERKI